MRVLLINDSTSNPNWGDRAAPIALRMMISGVGGRITAAITELELGEVSFFDTPSLRPIPRSKSRQAASLLLPPIVPKASRRIARRLCGTDSKRWIPETWRDFEPKAKEALRHGHPWSSLADILRDVDVAVIHGDGCMVGHGILPRTELFLAYLLKTRFKLPVTIVNHTVDLEDPVLRQMVENVYPMLDDVTLRDPLSVEICREFCDARFAADSAFAFMPATRESWTAITRRPTYADVWPDSASFDSSSPYLCVGGSSLFGHNRGSYQGPLDGYRALLSELASVYPGQIVLTASDVVDQDLFRPLAQKLGLPLIGLSTPVQQAVDILGNADAYIGGRWHPSIFAMRGGTPVLALSSKTSKMKSLMDMAKLGRTPFDAMDLTAAAKPLAEQLVRYLEQGNRLRGDLAAWAAKCACDCWGNVDYLVRQRDALDRRDPSRQEQLPRMPGVPDMPPSFVAN